MATSTWTQELRDKAAELYTEKEPTPENTMEIVKEVADEIGQTVNGTRLILTKAGVYIAKAKPEKTSSSDSKEPRRAKATCIEELSALIVKHNAPLDEEIIGRLTGKAADYFASVIIYIVEN